MDDERVEEALNQDEQVCKAYEIDCSPLANAMAKEITYYLNSMGFLDIKVTTETLHLWAKLKVTLSDGKWQVWEVDITTIGITNQDLIRFIGELSLRIAAWIGIGK